ncbi:hypothetical protein FGIG_00687 [Fasciola gigantica]|uniref:Uncharacterized protein n=1 Tax=Fasciola gigantica TaxID=46835 RepID=A0A504YKB0_FASGI|nr:hypothetical protein FGIG_00687 [Fasciola gigantica]
MCTESLISKLFCVTNSSSLVDRLQGTISKQKATIIPNLQLDKLVDDDFIAAFCMKGKVTVIPIFDRPEFTFVVQDSILTLSMSPAVYAGFGLAARKVKTGMRRFYYHYRVNLRCPKFLRNGSLHLRLRQFLSTSSGLLSNGRDFVNSNSCFVDWVPDAPVSLVNGTHSPSPVSLACNLSSDNYLIVEPTISLVQRSLYLPEPFAASLVPGSETSSSTGFYERSSSTDFDADRARGMFHLLSLAATGLGHPPPETIDDMAECGDNPCLSNVRLSPMLSVQLLDAGPRVWHSPETMILTIQGIFTADQLETMHSEVQNTLKRVPTGRNFAFLSKAFLRDQFPTDLIAPMHPQVRNNPIASLFLWEPERTDELTTVHFDAP